MVSAPFDLVIPSAVVPLSGGQAKSTDYDSPENFTPEIGRDSLIFSGKYFLVFATQDKNSGVNYYEVKEGGRTFRRAASPYLLENQLLTEWIFVRAVDYAGNTRQVELRPLKYDSSRKTPLSAQFIILIGAAVLIILIALIILEYLLLAYAGKPDKR